MDFARTSKICSFCGEPGGPDRRLAGGLGAMICDECVAFFHETNSSPAQVQSMSRPPWETMNDTEMVAKLGLVVRSAEQNTAFVQDWVDLLRERRISWAEIGRALGVSKQSAWERYAGKSPRGRSATA